MHTTPHKVFFVVVVVFSLSAFSVHLFRVLLLLLLLHLCMASFRSFWFRRIARLVLVHFAHSLSQSHSSNWLYKWLVPCVGIGASVHGGSINTHQQHTHTHTHHHRVCVCDAICLNASYDKPASRQPVQSQTRTQTHPETDTRQPTQIHSHIVCIIADAS